MANEIIELNLNDAITCTLTASGAKLWNAWYDGIPCDVTVVFEGDEVTTEMWHFCAALGSGFVMGNEPPVNMKVKVERR